ncbi:hypothetical protein [Amylibacter sp. IMCC11727]|uniref:hypothetical protein n=1 Tax=Amylibacter sp. IMCC11727 TaxID=3039851 RepID=UPI00244DB70F|nr:hypothetical protein [Amylibacter sp. IMCC11727]WGI23033.1 hypothetical protein QBD29_06325 [Amylibacter sp. IMCC11727]
MVQIIQTDLPKDALLARYAEQGHTDCFAADVGRDVVFADFVEGFYTSWLFKVERVILRLANHPSIDAEAVELAAGTREQFAAWTVEDRVSDQILMCDISGRTRSWLMVEPRGGGTRLYFGSAVVPDQKTGRMGFLFRALMGFHKLYSILLLKTAARNL